MPVSKNIILMKMYWSTTSTQFWNNVGTAVIPVSFLKEIFQNVYRIVDFVVSDKEFKMCTCSALLFWYFDLQSTL